MLGGNCLLNSIYIYHGLKNNTRKISYPSRQLHVYVDVYNLSNVIVYPSNSNPPPLHFTCRVLVFRNRCTRGSVTREARAVNILHVHVLSVNIR